MIEIKNYILGIIGFTFIMVAGTIFLSSVLIYTPENDEQLQNFNQTFSTLEEVTAQTDNMQSSLVNSEPEQGLFGALGALINSAWNSIKLVFSSFSFMNDAFRGLTTFAGVPAFVPTLIIAIVSVTLVFAIWNALFKTS